MLRMSKVERVADIAKRCNMSSETVSAVLKAERESMMESLKKGEKVTLAGRVIVNPIVRHTTRLDSNGNPVMVNYLAATAKPIGGVLDELSAMDCYETAASDENENESLAEELKRHKIQIMNISMLE